jgi:GABA permease
MSTKARVLVVANRTVDSSELISALRRRVARSPACFTLLVPAVPRGLAWAADMKAGTREAAPRADAGAARMHAAGLDVSATMVGDPDPIAAVGDLLLERDFDEIVISTLPHSVSRWLRLSLPQRVRRMTELPVTHVTAREFNRRGRSTRPLRRRPAATEVSPAALPAPPVS